MYVPSHFEEQRVEVLHQHVRDHPLGTLVTLDSTGINANHIPFAVDADPQPFGTLRGHVARANPVWRNFSREVEALVIFHGPQAYVTPSWYPTKNETGEVVPTYNYIVVHAYGSLHIHDDVGWLRDLVSSLTNRFEAKRTSPWHVTDAPDAFIAKQLQAIVGIEMPITKLTGKWKVSQNRPAVDRAGVVAGLSEAKDLDSLILAGWVAKSSKPSRKSGSKFLWRVRQPGFSCA